MKTALLMKPAAVAAMVESERVEERRITMWLMIPLTVRRLALAAAEMPRERGCDGLDTFTAHERGRIVAHLQVLMSHMSMAEQCMRDTTRRTTVLH